MRDVFYNSDGPLQYIEDMQMSLYTSSTCFQEESSSSDSSTSDIGVFITQVNYTSGYFQITGTLKMPGSSTVLPYTYTFQNSTNYQTGIYHISTDLLSTARLECVIKLKKMDGLAYGTYQTNGQLRESRFIYLPVVLNNKTKSGVYYDNSRKYYGETSYSINFTLYSGSNVEINSDGDRVIINVVPGGGTGAVETNPWETKTGLEYTIYDGVYSINGIRASRNVNIKSSAIVQQSNGVTLI